MHALIRPKQQWKPSWKLKWNHLTHPPYSPDLAPSDFYLFGRLKSDLQGMRFADDANQKPFLKRASGCFQNVGKNVLTPEGSTLKTDMCKLVFGNYGFKKKSVPVIFEPPCTSKQYLLKQQHSHIYLQLYIC